MKLFYETFSRNNFFSKLDQLIEKAHTIMDTLVEKLLK